MNTKTPRTRLWGRTGLFGPSIALLAVVLGCSESESPTAPAPPPATGGIRDYVPEVVSTGARFIAVSGAASDDVYALCLDGMVFQKDGAAWSAAVLPLTIDRPSFLEGLFAVSRDAVFAVGNQVVYRFDGTRWHADDPGTDQMTNASSVWGDAPDNVYAVGFRGGIFHWDGTAWTPMASPTGEWLEGVWGGVLGRVYAVGRSGTFLEYDGVSWTIIPTGTTEHVRAVWGAGSLVYLVGDNGTVRRWNGTTMEEIPSPTPGGLRAIWGTSPSSVYVAGASEVFRYDGSEWTPLGLPDGPAPSGLWGNAGDDLYVSDQRGGVLHFDGTAWDRDLAVQRDAAWTTVHGFSEDDVFVGGSVRIGHYDGTDLTVTDVSSIANGAVFGLWGTSGDDVWAVGFFGTALHHDGTFWSAVDPGTGSHLRAVWGASSDAVFAVGAEGTIVHWDGTAWSGMDSGTTAFLRDVEGTAPDDAWAVGADGTILHYDGTRWVDHASPTASTLQCVSALAADDVWALASSGELLRYDGTAWRQVAAPPLLGRDLLARETGELFVADSRGAVRWFDGSEWRRLEAVTASVLEQLWVSPDASEVWTVTQTDGNVIRYRRRD